MGHCQTKHCCASCLPQSKLGLGKVSCVAWKNAQHLFPKSAQIRGSTIAKHFSLTMPATKILLWHLADRHNKDTGRCDPSQERSGHDCEMSRATANRHLKKLEDAALLRRFKRVSLKSKRQAITSYELAFDLEVLVSHRPLSFQQNGDQIPPPLPATG